jgi:hypothetical protein
MVSATDVDGGVEPEGASPELAASRSIVAQSAVLCQRDRATGGAVLVAATAIQRGGDRGVRGPSALDEASVLLLHTDATASRDSDAAALFAYLAGKSESATAVASVRASPLQSPTLMATSPTSGVEGGVYDAAAARTEERDVEVRRSNSAAASDDNASLRLSLDACSPPARASTGPDAACDSVDAPAVVSTRRASGHSALGQLDVPVPPRVFLTVLRSNRILLRAAMLLWFAWFFGVCSFVSMNVFFPTLLEDGGLGATLNSVLYTGSGVAGAVLGPIVVETRLGRRGSLRASTASAAVCTFVALWCMRSMKIWAIVTLILANAWFQTMCKSSLCGGSHVLRT